MFAEMKKLATSFLAGRIRSVSEIHAGAPFEQPEDPSRQVRMRRIKRQLKAGLSLALALAAGLFLSCKEKKDQPDASPAGGDAKQGKKDGGVQADKGKTVDKSVKLDVKQHRDGMPVLDNLLE